MLQLFEEVTKYLLSNRTRTGLIGYPSSANWVQRSVFIVLGQIQTSVEELHNVTFMYWSR